MPSPLEIPELRLKLTDVEGLAPGSSKVVEVNEQEIFIFNEQGILRAVSNVCPHRGAPLGEGVVKDGKVYCPWHCFDFDLKTGECSISPMLNIEAYEVSVESDFVRLSGKQPR